MNIKILQKMGVFAVTCCVIASSWSGCQAPSESDIEIANDEVNSHDYKIELTGDAIAPMVYRNLGCGLETVSVEEDIAIYYGNRDNDDWHRLTDIQPDYAAFSVTGVISTDDRETHLEDGETYDVRIDLPAETRYIPDAFVFIANGKNTDSDSGSDATATDSDSLTDDEAGTDSLSDSDFGASDTSACSDSGDCDDSESAAMDSETTDTSIDTGDSGPTTDSDTNSMPDTDSATESELDSASGNGTDGDTGTSTETDMSTETDTVTDTFTETDTGTDTDGDTDTYPYADGAIFAPVGFVGSTIVDPFNNNPNAATVYARSAFELQNAINMHPGAFRPTTVYVSGTISGVNEILVDHKTNLAIVGDAGSAVFVGTGINISNSSNLIIRNVKIQQVQAGNADGINVTQSDHIWIDHCEIYNDLSPFSNYDGLLDMTNESDYITVSWCYFHDNRRGLIAGANDSSFSDADYFHVTWHHNIFKNISPGQISMRFGQGHVFNNLFEYDYGDATTGVSSRMGACVRPELNVFDGITTPLETNQSGDVPPYRGSMEVFENDYGGYDMGTVASECELKLPKDYEYLITLNPLDGLRSLLEANCGVGKDL